MRHRTIFQILCVVSTWAMSMAFSSISVNARVPPTAAELPNFLQQDEIIDWKHPSILKLAQSLKSPDNDELTTKACFEYVRDEIQHSIDYKKNPVTCIASDVLEYRTGFCYAKSHLLAALLRANGIPTGFCYQRLCLYDDNQDPYCLHGLNAVFLSGAWYRVDCRGNKENVNAEFHPPREQLAYAATLKGEVDFDVVLSEPLPVVTRALNKWKTWEDLVENLPDAKSLVKDSA